MEKSKVDMFILMNSGNFKQSDLMLIKEKLEKLEDDKFILIQGMQLQTPDTIFLIAILLGWERFWLNDVALGVLKVLTGYGCMIWWLVDIFSAKERTYKYNFGQFNQALAYL
jgi:hypothetical protein|tara:strand:- start:216 stop:551 length:336 start_codon:yes stop_codon:yes gene_type:complete